MTAKAVASGREAIDFSDTIAEIQEIGFRAREAMVLSPCGAFELQAMAIALSSKRKGAPLEEVEHQGNTYAICTPGDEFEVRLKLPDRGGEHGFTSRLFIDGKRQSSTSSRSSAVNFRGYAVDKEKTTYNPFRFASTILSEEGGGGASSGYGGSSSEFSSSGGSSSSSSSGLPSAPTLNTGLGRIVVEIREATRAEKHSKKKKGGPLAARPYKGESVGKGKKFFMNPSLSTSAGSSTSHTKSRVSQHKWTKGALVSVLELRYETAETLRLRGADINMAKVWAAAGAGKAGGASGAGGASPSSSSSSSSALPGMSSAPIVAGEAINLVDDDDDGDTASIKHERGGGGGGGGGGSGSGSRKKRKVKAAPAEASSGAVIDLT